jgi:glyoxylase-like metal-dependent hydrolase (beta-lactamase superfamily II)
VLHLGKGNTEGDLVVWLPRERLLFSGDLLVEPIPYGFGSFPAAWIEVLDRVAALGAEVIVPGHGEPMRDLAYLRRLQAVLREVRAQVGASVARGLDLDATRKALDLSALEKDFTLGDDLRKFLWTAWWVNPIARSAWLEAKGLPIVQGASDETG